MKTKHALLRTAGLGALLLGACVLPAMSDDAAGAAARSDSAKPAKPAIEKGMSADQIRAIIGEPKSIKHMNNPDLKAETWTYRRKIRTDTTQEVVGDEQRPAWVGYGMGDSNGMGTVSVPVYKLKHTTYYQVTALLMVDDSLVEARQWVEQETGYTN